MLSDGKDGGKDGESARPQINHVAIEEASIWAKERLEEIQSYEIKRKKHPSLTIIKVISALAGVCKEAGIPPNEITALVRKLLKEEIRAKLVSNETIDNLPSDYKDQALSMRGKQGREEQLKKLKEKNEPMTILPSRICGERESESKSLPNKLPLSDSNEDPESEGHPSRLDTVPQSHNEKMPSPDYVFGQNTSFVSSIYCLNPGKPSISYWR
jgi:hypothetical protein